MTDVQATYAIHLDGAEVGQLQKIEFRDYRHSQTRVMLQLAPRTGWVDSAIRDVHDRRYQAIAAVLTRRTDVDPEDAQAVARSPRVTLRRIT